MTNKALTKQLEQIGCKIEKRQNNLVFASLKYRSISWVIQENKAVALLGFIGDQDVTHNIYNIKQAIAFLQRG